MTVQNTHQNMIFSDLRVSLRPCPLALALNLSWNTIENSMKNTFCRLCFSNIHPANNLADVPSHSVKQAELLLS